MQPMKSKISIEHFSTALKYAGISFIAGAVNHGFFSGARSFMTAGLGILFFILGTFIQLKINQQTNLLKELLLSAFFSIGLGFFTGGLQHFPDSPSRSLWVVPTGFIISFIALIVIKEIEKTKKDYFYGLFSGIAVIAICFMLFTYFQNNPSTDAHSHGEHGHDEIKTEPLPQVNSDIHAEKSEEHRPTHSHKPGTKPHND